jgi:hypothetical protein
MLRSQNDIGDRPDIERAMRTGFASHIHDLPRCPECGEELTIDDWVFVRGGEVLGCEHCIERRNSDVLEETA